MKNTLTVNLFFMLKSTESCVLCTPNILVMSAEYNSVDEFLIYNQYQNSYNIKIQ